jgi:hypothetical protein
MLLLLLIIRVEAKRITDVNVDDVTADRRENDVGSDRQRSTQGQLTVVPNEIQGLGEDRRGRRARGEHSLAGLEVKDVDLTCRVVRFDVA